MSKEQGIPIKLVVIGDGSVGKTCALLTYTTNKFPEDYIPTIFDNYSVAISVDEKPIKLGLWDTAGQEEYGKIRPLSYPNTDVFLIMFAVNEKSSFINAYQKWYPELKQNVPNVPIVLVGLKIDMRQSDNICVSRQEAEKIAQDFEIMYMECSSKTRQGLQEMFERAVKLALANKQPSKRMQAQNKKNVDSSCQLI